MAYYAALTAALGGAAQQKVTNYQDALAQQASGNQLAEQKREFDITHQETQKKDALADSQGAQLARSQALEAKLQLPKGWSSMPPEMKISYLEKRQTAALQVGDYDLASATQTQINSIPRAAEGFAKASLDLARPKMLNDTIAAKDRELKEKLGAQSANVIRQIQGRADLAQFNDAQKRDIAVLAADSAMARVVAQQQGANARSAFTQAGANGRAVLGANAAGQRNAASIAGRLTGDAMNDDVREAIATYTAQMRAAANPTSSTYGQPQAGMAPLPVPGYDPSAYAPQGGYGQGGGYQLPPMPPMPNMTMPPLPGGGGGNAPAPTAGGANARPAQNPRAQVGGGGADPVVSTELGHIKDALARGADPKKVQSILEARTDLSPQQKGAIEQAALAMIRQQQQPNKPLPRGGFASVLQGGGSGTPASPFSLPR